MSLSCVEQAPFEQSSNYSLKLTKGLQMLGSQNISPLLKILPPKNDSYNLAPLVYSIK